MINVEITMLYEFENVKESAEFVKEICKKYKEMNIPFSWRSWEEKEESKND